MNHINTSFHVINSYIYLAIKTNIFKTKAE